MSEPPRRYAVGYALTPKKQLSFVQPSLVELSRERGIDLVAVDLARPLADQGPFDCIIHKVPGDGWEAQLHEYLGKHPAVPVIDPPEAIERLHSRISMLQVVSDLRIPQDQETFGVPKQIVIRDRSALLDANSLAMLRFPVIAKPLVADGSARSHDMALVSRQDGLIKQKPPLVLQEFVNHGGVVFKVYVVGDYVKCVKRKSLPDVSEDKLEGIEGSLSFSQISNMTTEGYWEETYYETMHLEEAEMPPLSFITSLAQGLRREMGLNLFNFDAIRDNGVRNHYLIIDINYFPGYEKMPSYEVVLTDFFSDVLRKKSLDRLASPANFDEVGDNTQDNMADNDTETRVKRCNRLEAANQGSR